MGYLVVHCKKCHNKWALYLRNMGDQDSRFCPHCDAYIDDQTYNNQIVPAWASMEDANIELTKDFLQYDQDLFTVDYIGVNTVLVGRGVFK